MPYAKVFAHEVSAVSAATLLHLKRPEDEVFVVVADDPQLLPPGGDSYDVKTASLRGDRAEGRTLFGRRITGHYHPEKLADAVEVSHAILPLVSEQQGFVGVYLFTKPSGENFSVSIWESEDASNVNIDSGWFKEQVAKFAAIYREPPRRDSYVLRVRAVR